MTEVFQVNFLASEIEHSKSLQQVTIVTLIPQVLKRVDMFFLSVFAQLLLHTELSKDLTQRKHI